MTEWLLHHIIEKDIELSRYYAEEMKWKKNRSNPEINQRTKYPGGPRQVI